MCFIGLLELDMHVRTVLGFTNPGMSQAGRREHNKRLPSLATNASSLADSKYAYCKSHFMDSLSGGVMQTERNRLRVLDFNPRRNYRDHLSWYPAEGTP